MKHSVTKTVRVMANLAAITSTCAMSQMLSPAAAAPSVSVAPSAQTPAGLEGWTPVTGEELAAMAGSNEIWSNWHSGKCMEIYADSGANGAEAVQWSCNGSPNQRWNTKIVNGRYFEFRNANSDKCLEIRGDSKANGATANQWSCNGSHTQQWTMYSSNTTPQFYKLTNRNSDKCLEVLSWRTEDRAPLGQWRCHDGNNQRWTRE